GTFAMPNVLLHETADAGFIKMTTDFFDPSNTSNIKYKKSFTDWVDEKGSQVAPNGKTHYQNFEELLIKHQPLLAEEPDFIKQLYTTDMFEMTRELPSRHSEMLLYEKNFCLQAHQVHHMALEDRAALWKVNGPKQFDDEVYHEYVGGAYSDLQVTVSPGVS